MTWLRRIFRTRPTTAEIDAELRDHLERCAADLRRQGVPADIAMRQARMAFGGVISVRDQCREAHTRHGIDRLLRWTRDVARGTRRDPLVTFVCIATLGLGIAATTAVATLVDAMLLRPLPYPHASRMVELWTSSTTDPTARRPGIDHRILPDLQQALDQVVSHVEGYQYGSVTLTGAGEPQIVSAPRLSPGLLEMLGVVPVRGRLLGPEDAHGAPNVVISERMWLDRFGGDPDIVGRSLTLDDEPHLIVGVMPRHLQFPWQPAVLWRPLPSDARADRTQAIARLRDGVAVDQAGGQLAALSTHLRDAGLLEADRQLVVTDLVQRRRMRRHGTALAVMLEAVGLVLVIACLNVSSLLLARAASRESEFALRAALGAGRASLATRLFGEGLVIALAGGVTGLTLAHGLIRVILSRLPDDLSFMNVESVNTSNVAMWALGTSAFTAIGISLLPMFRTGQAPPSSIINGNAPSAGTGRDNAWQSTLVVLQLAAVLLVLSGGGLLLRSFVALASVPPGYDVKDVMVASLDLPRHRYGTGASNFAFMNQVIERTSHLPGTRAVTFSEGAPPSGSSFHVDATIEIDGVVRDTVATLPTITVMPDYFATLGIRMLEGRTFRPGDSDRSVIVSKAVATRYWPDTSPIGRQFRWTTQVPQYTVVGVAADAKHGGLDDEIGDGLAMYVPYRPEETWPYVTLLVRTDDGRPSMRELRQTIASVDPDLPVRIETMEERLAASVSRQRFFVLLAMSFSVLALLMAGVGIFGNAAYWVARRRRELALRMAIGASPTVVRRFVLARCVRLALIGTALGLVGAAAAAPLLEALLFGIHRYDPWTFAGVAALLATLVVLAAYLPARRASRLDPWKVLQA